MRTLTVILLILINGIQGYSQEKRDFAWYNMETYRLYESKDWDSLITTGQEAIKHQHDFFYLRLRMGIAYYELEKYRNAEIQFCRALNYSPGDPLSIEYLYYSRLFSGRHGDALLLYEKYKHILNQRGIRSPNSIVKSVYSEAGIKIDNPKPDTVGNIGFYLIGLTHQWGRVKIFQSFNQLSQKFTQVTEINGGGPGPGGPTQMIENEVKYSQNEYYIGLTLPIIRGLQFLPAYHYQSVDGLFGNKFNNQAYSLGIRKNLKLADLYIVYGNSNINRLDQNQWTMGGTLYPLSNLNLYIQSHILIHEQDGKNRTTVFGNIGIRISPAFWLELSGYSGSLINYQEFEEMYLQNAPDEMENRLGVRGIVFLSKRVTILSGYSLESRISGFTGLDYVQHMGFIGVEVNLQKF